MDSIGRNGHRSTLFFRCNEGTFSQQGCFLKHWKNLSLKLKHLKPVTILTLVYILTVKQYAIPKSPNSQQRSAGTKQKHDLNDITMHESKIGLNDIKR